jgi:hypothetical protein
MNILRLTSQIYHSHHKIIDLNITNQQNITDKNPRVATCPPALPPAPRVGTTAPLAGASRRRAWATAAAAVPHLCFLPLLLHAYEREETLKKRTRDQRGKRRG